MRLPLSFRVSMAVTFLPFVLAACVARQGTAPMIHELWDYNDPAGSRTKFEEVLAREDLDKASRLEIETQIARTYSLEANFDSAHAVLDDLEPKIEEGMTVVRVRYLLEKGRTHNSSGEKEVARDLFVRAFQEAERSDLEDLAIDAAHMVAIAEDEFDDRMAWNLRALELAENAEDRRARKWIGSLTNNIGWDYFDKNEYDKALTQFKKSQGYYLEDGSTSREQIARWSIARTLRSLGFIDDALEIQLALFAEHEAAGTADGFVCEELGELYLAKGEVEKSKPFFAKAFESLSEDVWLQRNEAARLARLKDLSH